MLVQPEGQHWAQHVKEGPRLRQGLEGHQARTPRVQRERGMVVEGIAGLPLGQLQRPVGHDVEEEVGSVRCLQGYHIWVCKEP